MASKSHERRKGQQYRRIFRVGAVLSLLFSLMIIVIATQATSMAVPLIALRLGSNTLFLFGIAMVIVSLLTTIFPSRWGISLLMFQVFTVAGFALGSREPSRGDFEINLLNNESTSNRVWLSSVDWHEPLTRTDSELAYRGVPDSEPRIHHRDFDVTYRLGPDGYRVMPVPKQVESAPTIVFLGCSMTLGAGCANEDIFAWLLAENAWHGYQVKNWSVSGWGTLQAARNLDKALAFDPLPKLIIYALIGDHIKRNGRRDSWHKKYDYLVFNEDGEFERLAEQGEGTLPDSPELRASETRVTHAALKRMKEKCEQKGVPFAVLYLDDKDPFGPGRCEQVLDVSGLNVIDLRQSFTEVYPNDFHLTPLGHQILARAIARDQTLASVSGLADLHQPTVFPEIFPHERDFRPALVTDDSPEKHRRVEYESTERSLIVKKIESFGGDESKIAFGRVIPPMKRGQRALVSFQVHSSANRKLSVLIDRFCFASPPMSRVHYFTSDQGLFRQFLEIDQDLLYPRVRIRCGGDDTPFEIRDFEVDIVDQLPTGFDWLQIFEPSSFARFGTRTADTGERIVRVDELRMDPPANWKIQYQVAGPPVVAGRTYRVSFRVRSDRPKVIPVVLQKEVSSGQQISDFQGLNAGTEWKDGELTFVPKSDSPSGTICFTLGQDTTAVEFQNVRME